MRRMKHGKSGIWILHWLRDAVDKMKSPKKFPRTQSAAGIMKGISFLLLHDIIQNFSCPATSSSGFLVSTDNFSVLVSIINLLIDYMPFGHLGCGTFSLWGTTDVENWSGDSCTTWGLHKSQRGIKDCRWGAKRYASGKSKKRLKIIFRMKFIFAGIFLHETILLYKIIFYIELFYFIKINCV